MTQGTKGLTTRLPRRRFLANQSGATAGAVAASDGAAVMAAPRNGRGTRASTPLPRKSSQRAVLFLRRRGRLLMRVFRAAGSEVKRLLGSGNPTTMPYEENIVPLETPAGYAPLDI